MNRFALSVMGEPANGTTPGTYAAASADACMATVAALGQNRSADAVRQFLHALEANALSAEQLLSDLREHGGKDAVEQMVLAFATFGCPYCRNGFETCSNCRGGGRGEDRRYVCQTCDSLGVVSCDFCGGSGFATYSFVPEALRAHVAAARSELAVNRIASDLKRALSTGVARDGIGVLRKALAKHVLDSRRDVAILANAAQFAPELHAANPDSRHFTGRLFGKISRSASKAQARVASIFAMLSAISQDFARLASDPDTQEFERERAERFDLLSRKLAVSAGRRSTLFAGH